MRGEEWKIATLVIVVISSLLLCVNAAYPGPINGTIDADADGHPDVLRYADEMPVYPGSRCGENFEINPPTGVAATDAMLCVGRPTNGAKEQDGDSGGPVFTKINGELVQIGVNTGTYAADWFRYGDPQNSHIGYYTRVDWNTIKPWLETILSGDISGARAMTCAQLGGPTAPNPDRRDRKLQIEKTHHGLRRQLISGATRKALEGQFPSMVSTGNYFVNNAGDGVWESGCDGTLIARNVVLLAAHCFEYTRMSASENQMRLWPGAWNTTAARSHTSKMRFASEVLRHPCYVVPNGCGDTVGCLSATKPMEDIAVAILESDADSSVPVVSLLGQGTYASETLAFPVISTIAGWGRYCDPAADTNPDECTMSDWPISSSPPTPNPSPSSTPTPTPTPTSGNEEMLVIIGVITAGSVIILAAAFCMYRVFLKKF